MLSFHSEMIKHCLIKPLLLYGTLTCHTGSEHSPAGHCKLCSQVELQKIMVLFHTLQIRGLSLTGNVLFFIPTLSQFISCCCHSKPALQDRNAFGCAMLMVFTCFLAAAGHCLHFPAPLWGEVHTSSHFHPNFPHCPPTRHQGCSKNLFFDSGAI